MANFRVGFFVLCPNIWWGGGQMALLRVAQWLAGRSVPVEFITARVEGRLPFHPPEGVKIVDLHVPALKMGDRLIGTSLALSAVFGLARYFRNNTISIVIAPGWADGSLTLWAKKISKTTVKVGIWEQIHVSGMKSRGGNLYRRLAPKIVQASYKHADIVAACSIGAAEDIAKLSGLPNQNVRVIYNPIPPDIFQKAKEPANHPWFSDGKTEAILSVARLDPQKDLQTLIRAFSIVRKKRPVKLAILGEGEERPKLEALVRELGLENDVWMPGFVDNPFKFMKRASVFALSSRFEGFGMVLSEALAVGCPVVSTDCLSGPSEILEGGKWGKLVPVGDHEALAEAILETLENPPDREKLKQRGMDFHIDKIGQQWLELINSVIQNQ